MEKIKPIAAIKKYFFDGQKNPETGLPFTAKDVLEEVKQLTPEDKAELAAGAAKELEMELDNG